VLGSATFILDAAKNPGKTTSCRRVLSSDMSLVKNRSADDRELDDACEVLGESVLAS